MDTSALLTFSWIKYNTEALMKYVTHSPLYYFSKYILKQINIPVLVTDRQQLLSTVYTITDHSYVLCLFDDEIVTFYVNKPEMFICYFDPLNRPLCKMLMRHFKKVYENYKIEIIVSTPQFKKQCSNINLQLASVIWFIISMEKSIFDDNMDISQIFNVSDDFIYNFYYSLVISFRQQDVVLPLDKTANIRAICKSFVKQYMKAIAFECPVSNEYEKMSWSICKANVAEALLLINPNESEGVVRLKTYTDILEKCRESVVSHFYFLLELEKDDDNVKYFEGCISTAHEIFDSLVDVICILP